MKIVGWVMMTTAVLLMASVAYCADVFRVDGTTIAPKSAVSVTSSATLVSAANGNRKTLNCTVDSTAAVRWGDSTVTASTGQRLSAGSSVAIRNPSAVYMASEGSTVLVFCTEERG